MDNNVAMAKSLLSAHPDPLTLDTGYREILGTDYGEQFRSHRKMIDDRDVDVLLCDHLLPACFHAAQAAKIPCIITIALALTPDASASFINNEAFIMSDYTTQYESFFTRFYKMFILQGRLLWWKMGPGAHKLAQQQMSLGLEPHRGLHPSNAWVDSLKLVNNVFGLEAPRPMGPLVELVGPIMQQKYQPLTEDLKTFLDAHQKVAYVAFGQLSLATKSDIQLILTALMENIEQGAVDGFLWVTNDSMDHFPEKAKSLSKKNQAYSVAELFDNKHPHIRFIQWAPQRAVLLHPSTIFFISHGGAGSLHDALSAGKRLVMFPFFFDQHANARNVERSGLGRFLDYRVSQSKACDILRQVALDENGQFQTSVERFKALVQIHGKHGALRGADLVEEVAFMHKDGRLPHRYQASREMSLMKLYNIDLFGVLTTIIVVPTAFVLKLTRLPHRKVKTQ
ncbi:hypothetical protein DFQ28_003603 [Apophysomyces sp. BC1034]|nr:hypothetical protein DFQ30_003544 [Apophysomyces sp. BC1015]KAG0189280.1 hypothetical protein DFQ28_003603 [Apophysomyces sp. BC1034]